MILVGADGLVIGQRVADHFRVIAGAKFGFIGDVGPGDAPFVGIGVPVFAVGIGSVIRMWLTAMIYAEDAPKLESDLHRELTHSRVNAVNLRKEFFRTDLESIKEAVKKIAGTEAEFKATISANDYYETRRLQREVSLVEHV